MYQIQTESFFAYSITESLKFLIGFHFLFVWVAAVVATSSKQLYSVALLNYRRAKTFFP